MRRALAILAFLVAPAALHAQAAVAETCKDGTTSTVIGKGACSHHGGVDKKASAKTTPNATPNASTKTSTDAKKTSADTNTKVATTASTKKADRAAKSGPITYRPNTATPLPTPQSSGDPLPAPSAAPAPRPVAPRTTTAVPAGASAQCKDGTYSYSKTRRGTCSHHGGVSTWMGLAK